ncbi:hypothetical protein K7472_31525 [Streptomyces sp. PTM05]|uniref:Cyanobacterial TRADD-N associated 2 transmembrane domain-containing protein n=1 Tax=Streptantibioticus parmotrematis TaxID=2873249 RepID=A0ABS7R369_9ACTN|nr:hypothetical protein [Streptantibioticus parmotrematis]MBY8889339.1 hypothetical protein [Streptantibioticus parmotrematis]
MGEESGEAPSELAPAEETLLHTDGRGAPSQSATARHDSPLYISNFHIEQIGSRQNNLVVESMARELHPDPREAFLSDVLKFRLSEAKSFSTISRFCMAMGLAIALCGAVTALMGLGAPVGLSTILGGSLLGGTGGAFAVHGHRAQQRLTTEAERVEQELQLDRTREQALTLISEVDDPAIRDRLRTMVAMRTLGLAPPPEEAANRVFSPTGETSPAIATE